MTTSSEVRESLLVEVDCVGDVSKYQGIRESGNQGQIQYKSSTLLSATYLRSTEYLRYLRASLIR